MTIFPIPAEVTERALLQKIDGAIYCRNCLDHSPNWPFIMANIARYAQPGCKLLLWTDIFHGESIDKGHFNIVEDPALFRNLVGAFGFLIECEFSDMSRGKNYGCLATRS
jgi:hypothetical protein